MRRVHDMPFGGRLTDAGAEFRLWAPRARQVDLVLTAPRAERIAMNAQDDGWYSIAVDGVVAGQRYWFMIDDDMLVPDPASRFQPDGPAAASELIDPAAYDWQETGWRGRPWEETVLYELHVGTFTTAGTFLGAIEKLDHLAALGVTAIELLPVAECPGDHNWGYDGVDLFAVESRYGRPDNLKRLVEAAHAKGIMVFLDVVWNHFGPEASFLYRYAADFFTKAHTTPWGDAINFDQAHSATVRDFFLQNGLFWMREFDIDGLRLDAVHAIKDDSAQHVATEIAAILNREAGDRHFHIVDENEYNSARFLERDTDGHPKYFDAQWNDDFHHALHVLLTGEADSYYIDFASQPIALLGRALAEGFVYQGEPSALRKGERRGEPSASLPPTAFVSFLQNHDQIGNRPFGDRLTTLARPEALRAAIALWLLAPQIPMLFMGEEWATTVPFPFFCHFEPELSEIVRSSRIKEFAIGDRFVDPGEVSRIPDPISADTVRAATLDWDRRDTPEHRGWFDFYRHLLTLRRERVQPLLASFGGRSGKCRLLGDRALSASWRGASCLSLLANLGDSPVPAPAPPIGEMIYDSHPDALPTTLPPWSVRWLIAEGE